MRLTLKRTFIFIIVITVKLSVFYHIHIFRNRLSKLLTPRNQLSIMKLEKERESNLFNREDFVKNLREITKKLIEVRSSLNDETGEFIDEKYDYFQKLLMSNEEVGNKNMEYRKVEIDNEENRREINYTCPETYMGTKYGHPLYQKGFKRTNCTKAPLSNLVTFILDNPCYDYPNCYYEKLLKSIRKQHSAIRVHAIRSQTNNSSTTRARLINEIITIVTTPFIFLAPNIVEYDENLDIERLIDVMTSTNVVAVGGSVKEAGTGVWSHGCSQIELHRYTLKYRNGYEKSMDSCMQCDILCSPFLVRTDFIKKKLLRDIKEGYYEDWFMQVNPHHLNHWKVDSDHNTGLLLSCPDVMSIVSTPYIPDSDLVDFVNYWDIKRIVNPDNRVQWFGCKRSIKHRTSKCAIPGGMAVPPCCLANLADAVKFVMKACIKNGLVCELQEGTLLGAVKFQNALPWERDADITFLTADFEKVESLRNSFKVRNYHLKVEAVPWCCVDGVKAGGVFSINADGWHIEMYGQHQMDSANSMSEQKLPTRIEFAGEMVQVPHNPGSYARNRYGNEIFKHAEHWMTNGMKSGWEKYSPGVFQECEVPGHHGCLDQFTADGSLQFNERRFKSKTNDQLP